MVNKDAIALMTASLKDNAKAALYADFADFVEDEEGIFSENQECALHVRESVDYIRKKEQEVD